MPVFIRYFFIVLFSLTSTGTAISEEYNLLLLRTQASIFPKILLLDQNYLDKISDNTIIFSIIYDQSDIQTARIFKSLIEEQYNHIISDKTLVVTLIEFSALSHDNLSTAYYIMQGNSEQHKNTTAFAAENNRISFSYNYKDLDNNNLISLLIKEKTYIYLNKKVLHNYQIKFLPIFYKIVKVIE